MAKKSKRYVDETLSFEDCIGNAENIIEELGTEMRNWSDSLENTNLVNSEKYSIVSETASTLEDASNSIQNIETEDIPESENSITVSTYAKPKTRAERLSNALNYLSGAKDIMEKLTSAEEQGWSEITSEIENISSELESCSFPGMFG